MNRVFGGSNDWTNRVTASQPQPVPGVSSSLVRYQFRFRIPGEAICIIRPPQTSPRIFMNWSDGLQLECSRQYEVDVRVSLDGGATWCFDVASPSCVEPVTPWGKVCMVNITSSTYCPGELQGGSSSLATQGDGTLTLYPNPNNGDQLFISLTEVGAEVNTVTVDIYDLTGKRVSARTIQIQDGFVNSAMDAHSIANGLYMVHITAGEKTFTERLVIQK
ncbi:MAG: T9SS type A sorting domain-containing protein [Flavobacteriales bacterium]|nr:T9SS type A sorting domain-containing protein [Flavobacteriales bacterium]